MKVNNFVSGNNLNTSISSTMLDRVMEGDVLKVRVVEIASNELLLRLPDGTTFNAVSKLPVKAAPGDFFTFVVSNKTNEQVFLETISWDQIASDITPYDNLSKELSNINIKPTNYNIKIAAKLKSDNLPVTFESIEKITGLLRDFKNLDLPGAVLLHKNNVTANKDDVDSLEKLLTGNLKIIERLESLSKALNSILSSNENKKYMIPETLRRFETIEAPDGLKLPEPQDMKTDKDHAKDFFSDLFPKIDLDGLKNGPVSESLIMAICERLEAIKSSINTPNNKFPEIIEFIENIKKDIEFVDKMGRYNVYLQIPIVINQHKTTGELYVLKRKNSGKKSIGSSTSVLISLDTNYLGRVDSLLTLEGTTVGIDIRVENKQIFKVIKDNYKLIFENLQDKGYKLVDFKYGVIEEKINLANVEDYILKELKTKIYTLDCRV